MIRNNIPVQRPAAPVLTPEQAAIELGVRLRFQPNDPILRAAFDLALMRLAVQRGLIRPTARQA